MTDQTPIAIDHDECFKHLPKAPIIEAVIEIRARAEASWDEAGAGFRLKEALPDYPIVQQLARASFEIRFGVEESAEPVDAASPTVVEPGWLGARMESTDGRFVAKFTRDAFSLSRLTPYEDWDRFRSESMRLWEIYRGVRSPSEVLRLGVRFINRLDAPIQGLEFSDYFSGLGDPPDGFPTAAFLHKNSLAVPGHPYMVNLVRTFQPPEQADASTLALLLDIDVFCVEPCSVDLRTIEDRLADLHYLKNRVFFGTLTQKALDLCR